MMTETVGTNRLEAYIRDEYRQDKARIEALQALGTESIPLLLKGWDKTGKSWSYEYQGAEANGEDSDYSTSTNAMILLTLAVLMERTTASTLLPSLPQNPKFRALVDRSLDGKIDPCTILDKGLGKLIEHCYAISMPKELDGEEEENKTHLTYSSTYGFDDPLTLGWLSELIQIQRRGKSSEVDKKKLDHLKCMFKETVGETTERIIEGKTFLALDQSPPQTGQQSTPDSLKAIEHPYPLVRLIQLWESAEKLGYQENQTAKAKLTDYFEQGLLRELAYFSIPDSKFDPSALIFYLEGALRLNPSNMTNATVDQVMNILEQSQSVTPYWRPHNPILANRRGGVLFPVSVEIAHSLLRSVAILESNTPELRYFNRARPLFERYSTWLRAQRITWPDPDGNELYGWRSEYTGSEPESHIHNWLTSQIILYLFSLQLYLQKDVAQTMLSASRLQHSTPDQIDSKPFVEPLKGLRCIESDREFIFTREVSEHFVKPRESTTGGDSTERRYSMLLYGPPGTGKSQACEYIASELGWGLITVTPSDFLAGGPAEVEARAKSIFATLNEQRDYVILLDEIDHFLLDREGPDYKRQEGIFQFMTPGMLTKLNDLRSAEASVFIIATNYEERIDPAIKRPGRIDAEIPLLPPDYNARRDIVKKCLVKFSGTQFNVDDLADAIDDFARRTPLYTYTEIRRCINSLEPASHKRDTSVLEDQLKKLPSRPPEISLGSYRRRFKKAQYPSVEFLLLVYLWLEPLFLPVEDSNYAEIRPNYESNKEAVKDILKIIFQTSTTDSPPEVQKPSDLLGCNYISMKLDCWLRQEPLDVLSDPGR